MNIDEAENNLGCKVVSGMDSLKNSELWIAEVKKREDGFCFVTVRDEIGCIHSLDPKDIELLHSQNIGTLSVNLDTSEVKDMLNQVEIRKEIALLLIQNGHVVDKGFKDTVDNVLDAITL